MCTAGYFVNGFFFCDGTNSQSFHQCRLTMVARRSLAVVLLAEELTANRSLVHSQWVLRAVTGCRYAGGIYPVKDAAVTFPLINTHGSVQNENISKEAAPFVPRDAGCVSLAHC